jgi:hypothetical protein
MLISSHFSPSVIIIGECISIAPRVIDLPHIIIESFIIEFNISSKVRISPSNRPIGN